MVSAGYENSWGPYWDAMFGPAMVTGWINWKRGSTGVNIARRLWTQRESLRHAYVSTHGWDPTAWPVQHPGVVLDAVLWMAHPACLRCQWFGNGYYIKHREEMREAEVAAHQHELSDETARKKAINEALLQS